MWIVDEKLCFVKMRRHFERRGKIGVLPVLYPSNSSAPFNSYLRMSK
jgi:hypothetical protein